MSGYTKLFASILDSTVWRGSKEVKILWVTMLAMANADGEVEAAIPGLAARAGLTVEETEDALETLMSPDTYSRSPAAEGRRVVEVDGGWLIVNHAKYRERADPERRREYLRKRREEIAVATTAGTTELPSVATTKTTLRLSGSYRGSGRIYMVVAGDRVKIGVSRNPWARLNQVREAVKDAELICSVENHNGTAIALHQKFAHLDLGRGWFKKDPEIIAAAAELTKADKLLPEPTTIAATTRSQAEAEAEAEATDQGDLLRRSPGREASEEDGSGFSPDELAYHLNDRDRREGGGEEPPLLRSEDEEGAEKGFPWRQVYAIFKRIVPEMAIPSAGAQRRDQVMRGFWVANGKSPSAFERLAEMIAASDYLMGRGEFAKAGAKRITWSKVFDKHSSGELRATRILNGEYANDKMAFLLEKAKSKKLVKVWDDERHGPLEIDPDEKLPNGTPRYRITDTITNGFPEYIDRKV